MDTQTQIKINTLFLRAEVSEFFNRMDRDFDGRLSFGEFMGEETPLEKVFKNMDKDGDGSVSKEVGIWVLIISNLQLLQLASTEGSKIYTSSCFSIFLPIFVFPGVHQNL